ncbi:MAG: NAD(P)/FAD-dependent oxidoreductase [Clostridia bacterium]|nr:NAD(P)/FAD-dependent oxidoreductase [Clostridia bacterium]
MDFDIAIIGGGVIGNMIARQLSAYDQKIVVLEKNNDISMETTKANSGIVHAGYDAKEGSMKAKMNVLGASLMEEACKKLHVPYRKTGTLVVAFDSDDEQVIKELYQRGIKNGVPNMRIIEKDELREIEPQISEKATMALYCKDAGIVSPYELSDAAADCAANNGVKYIRNFEVKSIDFQNNKFTISNGTDNIIADTVINAAGVNSDDIAKMIGDDSFSIIPRPGEYGLLDKSVGYIVNQVLFMAPTKMGKGVLVAPTTHGNVIVGPSSYDAEEKDAYGIRRGELSNVFKLASKSVPSLPVNQMITSFAGVRAHNESDDFIIAPSEKNNRFINVAGIASPGLASSPAIAQYVEELVLKNHNKELVKKDNYDDSLPAPVRINSMSSDEKKRAIAKNSAYGRIICRCETVTEGEIRDSINRPVGAVDIDGVKRRTRSGMGRCQGGFCSSKVMSILADELNKPINEITKFGRDSKIIYERTK